MKKFMIILVLLALVFAAGCSSEDDRSADTDVVTDTVSDTEAPDVEKDGEFLAKPEGCDLDFWICENVADVDFSKYTEIVGMVGGKEYVSDKYEVGVKQEDAVDVQILPDECVVYTLSAWPDYADYEETGYHVTKIVVTDPEISLYGITTESSRVEFRKAMTDAGFTIEDPIESGDAFIEEAMTPGGTFSIRYESSEDGGAITVEAPVSNRDGIKY